MLLVFFVVVQVGNNGADWVCMFVFWNRSGLKRKRKKLHNDVDEDTLREVTKRGLTEHDEKLDIERVKGLGFAPAPRHAVARDLALTTPMVDGKAETSLAGQEPERTYDVQPLHANVPRVPSGPLTKKEQKKLKKRQKKEKKKMKKLRKKMKKKEKKRKEKESSSSSHRRHDSSSDSSDDDRRKRRRSSSK